MEKIKIDVPDGYEIDRENSTFECIKFKKTEKHLLLKNWDEFCLNFPIKFGEKCIAKDSTLINMCGSKRDFINNKNVLPNKETANAMLALCQLIQLRDCYNDGWKPDWNDGSTKYCIYNLGNWVYCGLSESTNYVLSFRTKELRMQFLNNFEDLIEIAKPLL